MGNFWQQHLYSVHLQIHQRKVRRYESSRRGMYDYDDDIIWNNTFSLAPDCSPIHLRIGHNRALLLPFAVKMINVETSRDQLSNCWCEGGSGHSKTLLGLIILSCCYILRKVFFVSNGSKQEPSSSVLLYVWSCYDCTHLFNDRKFQFSRCDAMHPTKLLRYKVNIVKFVQGLSKIFFYKLNFSFERCCIPSQLSCP